MKELCRDTGVFCIRELQVLNPNEQLSMFCVISESAVSRPSLDLHFE